MDTIEALERCFDHAEAVIAKVETDQHGLPTPCSEWTVDDLMEHMIGVVARLGAAASGTPVEAQSGDVTPSGDRAARFSKAAASALAAWRVPGVLDQVIDGGAGPMPGKVLAGINLLDTATHTWDLATATGQPATLPEPVATAALEASRAIVSPEVRPGRFGPEIGAPAGAGPTEQLVAFLGRTP